MRKWFTSVALACGISVLAGAGSAQEVIQVQAQPAGQAQAQPAIKVQVQIQPAQVQIQPIQGGRADRIMPFPGPGRTQLTQADAVFVGRVTGFEPMDVEAVQVPGQAMVKYRIAVVQITETMFGLKKGTKEVRVGFVVQAAGVPNGPLNGPGGGIQILPAPAPGQPAIQPLPPFGGPRRPFPGYQQMQLTVGQDGLFTVNKHPKEQFFLSPNFQGFVGREPSKENFEAQVKTAKQLGKVMGDPVAALKADDKQDRYSAAAVLISRYRNPINAAGKPMKQEPIDAAESKLILQALAGGEWKVGVFNPNMAGPAELFNQLGVQPKDGYTGDFRSQQASFTAMQKWLDENQGKYRIQRFVVDPDAKVPMPGVLPGVQPGGIRPGIQPLPPIRPGVQPLPAPLPLKELPK